VAGRIAMNVTMQPGGPVMFTVSQSSVNVADVWAARGFDREWGDRPGGEVALVSLLAAQRTVAVHGGSIALASTDHGTSITMVLPAAADRQTAV